jgi:hypothetical protein
MVAQVLPGWGRSRRVGVSRLPRLLTVCRPVESTGWVSGLPRCEADHVDGNVGIAAARVSKVGYCRSSDMLPLSVRLQQRHGECGASPARVCFHGPKQTATALAGRGIEWSFDADQVRSCCASTLTRGRPGATTPLGKKQCMRERANRERKSLILQTYPPHWSEYGCDKCLAVDPLLA